MNAVRPLFQLFVDQLDLVIFESVSLLPMHLVVRSLTPIIHGEVVWNKRLEPCFEDRLVLF
jgi:hypothetical protein